MSPWRPRLSPPGRAAAALLLLALAACSPTAPKIQTANLYERAAALAKDPAYQAKMARSVAKLDEMRWMVGDWRTEITVFRTAVSPETRTEETTSFRQHGDATIADD